MITDPISDMIIRIKNAVKSGKKHASIPASGEKKEIAKILFEEGYIANYEFKEDNKQGIIKISFKYVDGEPSISGLKRISKPSRRVYVNTKNIPLVKSGYGVAIISTSKGIMSDANARKNNVGGEVLLYVW
ncbi:30S ribosomal protein S8 [candidate division WOR-3 bacterium]|nr:30S ribosomal protein S8 [candidate division WOR-3 bacterium]